MKLSEFLKQDTVTLTPGSYFAAITREEGYVPTYKDIQNIQKGRHLFKIVGDENNLEVIPLVTSEDGKEFIELTDSPIVILKDGKITYLTGRNHPDYKDAYNGREYHEVDNIPEGQEHRQVVLSFIDFANSEFSLGVHDFQIAGPEILEVETEVEPEPETP